MGCFYVTCVCVRVCVCAYEWTNLKGVSKRAWTSVRVLIRWDRWVSNRCDPPCCSLFCSTSAQNTDVRGRAPSFCFVQARHSLQLKKRRRRTNNQHQTAPAPNSTSTKQHQHQHHHYNHIWLVALGTCKEDGCGILFQLGQVHTVSLCKGLRARKRGGGQRNVYCKQAPVQFPVVQRRNLPNQISNSRDRELSG